VLSLLKRFPGYTLATLLDESEDLLRYVNIVDYGSGEVA
jgi:hypothetical protein